MIEVQLSFPIRTWVVPWSNVPVMITTVVPDPIGGEIESTVGVLLRENTSPHASVPVPNAGEQYLVVVVLVVTVVLVAVVAVVLGSRDGAALGCRVGDKLG
jgi:hypothetical protein